MNPTFLIHVSQGKKEKAETWIKKRNREHVRTELAMQKKKKKSNKSLTEMWQILVYTKRHTHTHKA